MEWEADGSQFSCGSNTGPGTRTGIRTGDHNSGVEPAEGDGSTVGEGNRSPTREVSNWYGLHQETAPEPPTGNIPT